MAGSVNKVILIGNLGHSPEVRTFQDGGKLCNLSLATSESWKDKATGERKERTQWHRIVITNEGLVGIAEKYLKKGSKVYIEGQLETRKYTGKDGAEKYVTEVLLRPYHGDITLLDSKGGGNPSDSVDENTYAAGAGTTQTVGSATAKSDFDDEIPF